MLSVLGPTFGSLLYRLESQGDPGSRIRAGALRAERRRLDLHAAGARRCRQIGRGLGRYREQPGSCAHQFPHHAGHDPARRSSRALVQWPERPGRSAHAVTATLRVVRSRASRAVPVLRAFFRDLRHDARMRRLRGRPTSPHFRVVATWHLRCWRFRPGSTRAGREEQPPGRRTRR